MIQNVRNKRENFTLARIIGIEKKAFLSVTAQDRVGRMSWRVIMYKFLYPLLTFADLPNSTNFMLTFKGHNSLFNS